MRGRSATIRLRRLLALLAAAIAVTPASAHAIDWTTYGFSASRDGFNPAETALDPGRVRALAQRWVADLDDGVIDTQPVFASGVALPSGRSADIVYAGTERGRFAAVDADSGTVIWRQELHAVHVPGCHELPEGSFGVTGTPVIDRTAGRVYVAGGRGQLYALSLASGAIEKHWKITGSPQHEHVWGGLTLVRGRIYVTIGSICDRPPYHGRVVAINPRRAETAGSWQVVSREGAGGGGIWAWGGVSADPFGAAIYAATGNALPGEDDRFTEHAFYAEHVVRLDRRLHVEASHYPGLPREADDADFGSTPVLYDAPGCPPQLAVVNKYGSLFVYGRDRIERGPAQRIEFTNGARGLRGQTALIGVPAYWPAGRMVYVANSSDGRFRHGIVAFRVRPDCQLELVWQSGAGPNAATPSSPSVAAGVVYYASGAGKEVVALDASTGQLLWRSGRAIPAPVFVAPTVAASRVFAGAWDGRLHAFAPQ